MSRQQYRRTTNNLLTNHLITIKPTNKGTIATLVDKRVFDINEETNQPSNQPDTNHQANQKPTTNKNKEERIKKKEEESSNDDSLTSDLSEEVKLSISEFAKMRKAMRKKLVLTRQRVEKLKRFGGDDKGMIAVLDQSIANNRLSIFELKNKPVVPKNDQERLAEFDRLGRERFKVVYPFELYQEVKQKYKAHKKQQLLDSMNNHAKETPQVI